VNVWRTAFRRCPPVGACGFGWGLRLEMCDKVWMGRELCKGFPWEGECGLRSISSRHGCCCVLYVAMENVRFMLLFQPRGGLQSQINLEASSASRASAQISSLPTVHITLLHPYVTLLIAVSFQPLLLLHFLFFLYTVSFGIDMSSVQVHNVRRSYVLT
jgi:hypothetical protein